MIRQICLSCYKTVELPDAAAGTDTPCPSCGKAIKVPAKYTAGVAEGGGLTAAPPPPLPPTTPPSPSPGPMSGAPPMSDPSAPPGLKTETLPPPPPPAPPADGPTRGFGCALDPQWLDWVPVGCVLLAFLLTFFPWSEMKLGGYTVMTQNGWEAVFAGKGDSNVPKDDLWKELDKVLADKSDKEKYKPAVLRSDWLVLLYLLLLLLAVLLFAAERVIRDPAAFPLTAKMTFLPPLWKWRLVVLGGLAVLTFLLLWFQAFQGFGLQRSLDTFAQADFKEKLADKPTDAEKRELWIKIGQTAGLFPVKQTSWLTLLLVLHATAVVALAGRFWLSGREAGKPLPRLDVKW